MSTYVLGSTAVARTATRTESRIESRTGSRVEGRRPGRPVLRLVTTPAPSVPRPGERPARLRLTRRGRVVVRLAGVLLGALVTAGAVLGGGHVALAGGSATPVPVAYHVVQPGESLWQIAGDVAPGVDRRDTVARIVELNALETGSLEAGRRIAVPTAE